MIRLILTPQFILFLMVVFAVAAGILFAFMPDHNRRVRSRLAMLTPRDDANTSMTQAGAAQLGAFGRWVGASALVGEKEMGKLALQLQGAGIKGRDKVAVFTGIKTALAFAGLLLGYFLGNYVAVLRAHFVFQFGVVMLSALMGWRLPDIVVSQMGNRRRRALREGIADALDLLVICVEAGLGLEQGLDRVSREMKVANKVVAEELGQTVAEMRVFPQVRDALDNLAKRSQIDLIKSIVTTFNQSLQYGTPLAQALRVLSSEMRAHRLLEIEARAARLPVWMSIPLICFILPCMFFVVGGPAVLQVLDLFKR